MKKIRHDFTPGEVMEPSSPKDMRRISRRSFAWAGLAVAATYSIVHWIFTRRQDNGLPWPLRRTLDLNEDLWTDFYSDKRNAPTYNDSKVTPERVNGDEGLHNFDDDTEDDFDPTTWKLKLVGRAEDDSPLELDLKDIQALPNVEQVTELFCIEGWSIVQKWKGVRFIDFAAKYPPPTLDGKDADVYKNPENLVPYVGMKTPNGGYYIGLDMPSALHPQTLLCWELNGKPLALEHGAPLRLVIPTKYGVKNIKRIGTIFYSTDRPKDFWAEQGYDWYAGL